MQGTDRLGNEQCFLTLLARIRVDSEAWLRRNINNGRDEILRLNNQREMQQRGGGPYSGKSSPLHRGGTAVINGDDAVGCYAFTAGLGSPNGFGGDPGQFHTGSNRHRGGHQDLVTNRAPVNIGIHPLQFTCDILHSHIDANRAGSACNTAGIRGGDPVKGVGGHHPDGELSTGGCRINTMAITAGHRRDSSVAAHLDRNNSRIGLSRDGHRYPGHGQSGNRQGQKRWPASLHKVADRKHWAPFVVW